MELILWRHCDAEAGVPDEIRALTPRGVREAQRMARWLGQRLPTHCRVLVSPAVRARQTAEALGRPFATEPALAAGASVAQVLRAAGWPGAPGTVLIVGHEPTLGRVAAYLLDGHAGERPIAKGGVVWIVSRPAESTGAEGALEAEATPDSLPDG